MQIDINKEVKKYFVWVILAAILFLVINYGIKTWKKLQGAKEDNALRNDLNTSNLSYDLTQYTVFADTLETSIGAWSTDENAVNGVFKKMLNSDDVKQLIKAFGSRTFTYLTGSVTLPQYIQNGMSAGEIEEINSILSNKGINITF